MSSRDKASDERRHSEAPDGEDDRKIFVTEDDKKYAFIAAMCLVSLGTIIAAWIVLSLGWRAAESG